MRRVLAVGLAMVAAVVLACGDGTEIAQGVIEVRLTDAPLSADSVQSVNVFVTRVDVRVATADEDEAGNLFAAQTAEDEGEGWVTVAEPGALFNLVDLQNGVTVLLGTAPIDAGEYRALRLVIDETQSSIVLKNGTELTGDADPFVKFPSGTQSGLKVQLAEPIAIVGGATTVTVIDFDLSQSFVMRGNEMRNGLLFKPVLRGLP